MARIDVRCTACGKGFTDEEWEDHHSGRIVTAVYHAACCIFCRPVTREEVKLIDDVIEEWELATSEPPTINAD